MECKCLVYQPYPDKNPELLDVAAYDIDCPIHGWRWDQDVSKIISLEECQEIDEKNANSKGYKIVYYDNNLELIKL